MGKIIWLLAGVVVPLILVKIAYAVSMVLVLPKTKGALFVSTSRRKIRAILEAVSMSPETRLVDLGCGDGRFLRAAWKRYQVRGVGYEINPWAYFLARAKNGLFRVPTEVRFRDFMKEDLSSYEVIFCYLFPDVLRELSPKLRQELRKGAIVISCNFPLPGWRPQKVIQEGDPIYIYQVS
ncbi:SAM-dependent methyltransferase [Thermosulfurimonas dismutans]|uniref:S-adenosylmethionine-dependent methyltransferase n=1 Tax=Thermosulfurimonas dismutans TaxID=999894 RepID=A0A179D722_9BACT|nr:class I SAM-dependent methyltransferase [Thermosulfurimonas dismutans]OAQ21846.1 S-adenosylmethionine-dependent methyltransferase [Thermosulfurimonas dismutans]